MDWSPAWSPNGKKIAFVRYEGSGAQIWLVNRDGSHERALTSLGSWNDHPSWAPDGRRLVYSGRRNGGYDLFVLDTRTGRQHRITHDGALNVSPSWSPDGSLIAFVTPKDSGLDDVWVVRPDGSDTHVVTHGDADNESPTWSPYGSRILYAEDDFLGGDGTLHTIAVDGGDGRAATPSFPWSAADPSWQPLR